MKKVRLLGILLAAVVLVWYVGRENREEGAVKVIAHRGGAMEAPENTLAAVEHAAQLGADMVEIDLRLTKDGVVTDVPEMAKKICSLFASFNR